MTITMTITITTAISITTISITTTATITAIGITITVSTRISTSISPNISSVSVCPVRCTVPLARPPCDLATACHCGSIGDQIAISEYPTRPQGMAIRASGIGH